MNHRQAVRKTVVTRVHIDHLRAGDLLFPSRMAQDDSSIDEAWAVWISTRSGLLPERSGVTIFYSKDEADEFALQSPVGSFVDQIGWPGMQSKHLEFVRKMIDEEKAPGAASAGDEESPLAFEVLNDAGVSTWGGLTKTVLDHLGKSRIGDLKHRFGENWEAAAAFEYCSLTLPPSAPAYVAAAYKFHWYITGDDFAAGYLWRDLECLVHGVETAAINAIEMRKNAGQKGGQKAEASRSQRRAALLDAMEAVFHRNPDIAKLGSRALSELAVGDCIQNNPALWSQGRGQVAEYLGEMHRGEAGKEIQARLHALLPKNRLSGFRTA